MALVTLSRSAVEHQRSTTAHALLLAFVASAACRSGSPPKQGVSRSAEQVSIAADGPKEPPKPESKQETPLSNGEAERLATEWVKALRLKDEGTLSRLTAVPFSLREPVEYPKCAPAHANKREAVFGALACIVNDEFLMEELRSDTALTPEVVPSAELPTIWAESLKSKPLPGRLMRVWLSGDGVGYELLLLTTKAGVSHMWKFAEYDSN